MSSKLILQSRARRRAVSGGDEGVDFQQGSVGFQKDLVEAGHEFDRVVDLGWLQAQRESKFARLVGLKPDCGVDIGLEDGVGILGRDFFNLHPACLGGHEDQLGGCAVEHDAQVKLAFDGRHLFDQDPLHLLALGPRLVRDQLHAKDLLGVFLGIRQGFGYLDAAAFSSATGVDLGFDHDPLSAAGKQPFSHIHGFFQRICHLTLGNRYAVPLQDVFRLILVNFHSFGLRTELPY